MITIGEINQTLFFDIETAICVQSFDDLSEDLQHEWKHICETRYKDQLNELTVNDLFYEKGALHLDFTRIVCISVGMLSQKYGIKVKALTGTEKEILEVFETVTKGKRVVALGGANISEYDIPLLARAYTRNSMQIPALVRRIIDAKPWEQDDLVRDICKWWSFGSYANKFNRFNMICLQLGVESPKSDIEGKDVSKVFYETGDVERIAKYCNRDVTAVIKCYLKIKNIYGS